jgi:hypothetical protein
MRPDALMFKLTDQASLSVNQTGEVTLLPGDQWHDITESNLGRFLLERQAATGWSEERRAQRPGPGTVQ